jgi:hypothetical protein
MAVPTTLTMADVTGSYTISKTLSDDSDNILSLVEYPAVLRHL